MIKISSRNVTAALSLLGALASVDAYACVACTGTDVWDLGNNYPVSGATGYYNTLTSGSANNITAKEFQQNNSQSGGFLPTTQATGSTSTVTVTGYTTSSSKFVAATLAQDTNIITGLSSTNTHIGSGAYVSGGGTPELMLLKFNSGAASLRGLTLTQSGWTKTGLDVWAWEGTGAPPSHVSNPVGMGNTVSGMTTAGWSLVSSDLLPCVSSTCFEPANHYADYSLSTTVSSLYWAVTAYGTQTDLGSAAFSIIQVCGTYTGTPSHGVPEPSSVALLAIGMIGSLGCVNKKRRWFRLGAKKTA